MNTDPPIIASFEKELRQRIEKEAKQKFKEKFVLEKWHAYIIVAVIFAGLSIFDRYLAVVSVISIIASVIDSVLKARELPTIPVIEDIEEDDEEA